MTSAYKTFWRYVIWTFPVTSFPFFYLSGTEVKPLSFLPALITAFLFFGRDAHKLKLHVESLLAICFLLYCSLSSPILSIIIFDGDTGFTYFKSISSLCIGILFYMVFRICNSTISDLKNYEKLIYNAMMISVSVGAVQILCRGVFPTLSFIPDSINYLLVDAPTTWLSRAHGLAFEPSWLASQLTVITIPLSLSRVISNNSLGTYRTPIGYFKRERVCLFVSILGIYLSGSRTGLFSIVFMVVVVFFSSVGKRAFSRSFIALLLVVATAILLAIRVDYVGNSIYSIYSANDVMDIVLSTNAVPRLSAWVSSFRIFLDHPIFGVGLGNSYRLYAEFVPDWALQFGESSAWASGIGFANPKSMIFRILAETGLIGGALFLYFVFRHLFLLDSDPHVRFLSRLTLIALIFNYLSLDTFALPTEWFALGYILVLKKCTVVPSVGSR